MRQGRHRFARAEQIRGFREVPGERRARRKIRGRFRTNVIASGWRGNRRADQDVNESDIELLVAGDVRDAGGAGFILVDDGGDFAAFVAEQRSEVLKHRSIQCS